MKPNKVILTICFLMLFAFCSKSVFAKGNYAILMQESPPGAGNITPGMGVHDFDEGSDVTLTTVANNGYHFVFWLGDVSDPTTNRTTVSVDGPKIIIAVFERDSSEFASSINRVSNGSPILTPRRDSTGGSGFSGGGGGGYSPPLLPPLPPPDTPIVPEPVPEPATMAIMAGGAYLALLRRKHSKTAT